jgi:hypothetical protein
VPSRATANYNEEFDDETSNPLASFYSEKHSNSKMRKEFFNSTMNIVEFYYDFGGFLPGKFFF